MTDVNYTWEEITLFAVMFASCLVTVMYFACKRSSLNDYVSGGGTLGVWPLSMSLIATSVSSINFSYATDIYQFGPHIMCHLVGVGVTWAVSWILIPLLRTLKLRSMSDYGTLRFNKYVKIFMSINILMFLNIHATAVSHSISLFISQISGVGFMKCFLIITLSCYIITAIGGFKGIVWTDTIQALAIFTSVMILAALGAMEVGGLSEVYNAALEGDRLSFDWTLDPTNRLTVWSATVAFSLQKLSGYSIVVPTIYQRYAALSTQCDARKMSIIHSLGLATVISFIFVLGYIMFALFKECDPVLSGKALNYDQVLPYFIGYIGERARLARCVYIIAYVSAAVSTLSSDMNTYAVTLYKDFIHDRFNKSNKMWLEQRMIQLVGLLLVITLILLVQILQHAGSITELTAITTGPSTIYLSIVLIGIYIPWIGSKGILWATFITLITMSWISIGTHMPHSRALINYPTKPMSIENCSNLNSSSIAKINRPEHDPDASIILRITPFLQPLMSVILMLIISSLATLITGCNDLSKLDRRLLSPWVRRFLPEPVQNEGEEVKALRTVQL